MLCYAVLCYVMLCYAVLYYTILYYAMLCYTILYYTSEAGGGTCKAEAAADRSAEEGAALHQQGPLLPAVERPDDL